MISSAFTFRKNIDNILSDTQVYCSKYKLKEFQIPAKSEQKKQQKIKR